MKTLAFRFLNSPEDIREAAMNTVRKEAEGEFSPTLFYRYLISEHSPIRGLTLRVVFGDMLGYTSVHFARHVHSIPYVSSNRPDRTGKARSVEDTVNHMMDVNCQALIDMARKRLCRQCSPDTLGWMHELQSALLLCPPERAHAEFYRALGRSLAPNCVYRAGCPEFKPFGFWSAFRNKYGANFDETIQSRYDAYVLQEHLTGAVEELREYLNSLPPMNATMRAQDVILNSLELNKELNAKK